MELYINSIKERIFEVLEKEEYWHYGLRVDDYNYEVGDICSNSHQLYQDPDFDENGNLIYPYCEDGIYKGFYDAGELDGTCAVDIYNDEIDRALKKLNNYAGDHIYLIGGDCAEGGNDDDEVIIRNAKVLMKLR